MTSLNNDIEIDLDGSTYTLRPSLKAATAISRQFNGFVGAYQAVAGLSLDAFQFIIRAGCTAKKVDAEELADAVWRTGLPKLIDPVTRYVRFLQHGGRDPDADKPEDDLGNDQA